MTKTGFTPGEWRASRFEMTRIEMKAHLARLIDADTGSDSVFWDVCDETGKLAIAVTGNGPRSEAHAYLIAAAPEMYEALEEMMVAFSMENIGVSASLRRTSAKASARLALIKARGEQEAT